MKSITQRQTEILSFIQESIERHKSAPTFREIGKNFDISVKAAYDHVKALEKKGVLECRPNRARSIFIPQLLDRQMVVEIPVINKAASGTTVLAVENHEGRVCLPAEFVPADTSFATYMRDASMTGAGLLEGDLVVIAYQEEIQSGDIIATIIDDLITIRRYDLEASRVKLVPENPGFHALYVQDVYIVGKLICSFRTYSGNNNK